LRLDFGDKYGQAQLYNNIGLIYSNIGAQPTALQNYSKAMSIWRELSALHDEMNTRLNEGKANAEMGDSDTALTQFKEVLVYCDTQMQTKDSPLKWSANQLKPFALNGIALVYTSWANPDLARDNYKEALELFRATGNRKSEADVLDNLGLLHAFLADTSQALTYFQDALILRQRLKDPRGLGITLSNIGFTYALLGKNPEALQEFDRALPLNRRAGDRRFEAYTLVWRGMAHLALNEPDKALEYYEKALAIQQDPVFIDLRGQAITLNKMGEAFARQGNLKEARDQYERALERWTKLDDDQGEALTLHGIAKIERDRHNLANARDLAEKAIRLVELLRYRVSSYQLQTTYFANQQDLYALGIDVRMQLYALTNSRADLEAAISLSEQARARNLLDLLARGRIEPNKLLSPEDAETHLRLDQQIAQLRQTLLRLRSIGQHKDAAIVEQKLTAHIKEQEDLLSSARNAASSDYERRQSRPLAPQEIQQLLDDNTVLLQYSLDDKRSHLWKLTRSDIKYFPLAGRTEIETAANQLRRALLDLGPPRQSEPNLEETRKRRQAARANFGQYAANLSRLILNDVAPQLGNKRLVIVGDGPLLSIPFEALPLPESVITPAHHASNTAQRPLLLESNEIVYQPSASALSMLRYIPRPNVRKTVAVLADPVLSNNQRTRGKDSKPPVHVAKERLTRSLRDIGDSDNGDFTLEPLEFSRQEAKDITALAPRGTSMMAVGFEANRRLATSPNLKQFSIVHFATHGILNDKNPELSGLVLSMFDKLGQPLDGYLTLRDIYNLDLPVHLVVVSACQTGVGKPVRGEGIIALTRGFMNAGAQSVVVSLWRVEDEATAELMKRFYTHMFGKNSMSPAAALRQAKIEMKDEYHPYQWAGFVLQGDWK
jgi:CHAT domain-containing protein/Tfp pilus assembly protein PilF